MKVSFVIRAKMGDTLIAYAAKAGSTAEDGDGQHSPFTNAILKNLTVPGLDIRLAFGRVRDEVMRATGSRQEPFVALQFAPDGQPLLGCVSFSGAAAVESGGRHSGPR